MGNCEFLSGFLALIALFIIAIYRIGSSYSKLNKLIIFLNSRSCSLNTTKQLKIVFKSVSRWAARHEVREPLKPLRIDYRGVIYHIIALPVKSKLKKSEMATTNKSQPLSRILLGGQ